MGILYFWTSREISCSLSYLLS